MNGNSSGGSSLFESMASCRDSAERLFSEAIRMYCPWSGINVKAERSAECPVGNGINPLLSKWKHSETVPSFMCNRLQNNVLPVLFWIVR